MLWCAQGSTSCRKHFRPPPSHPRSLRATRAPRRSKSAGIACVRAWIWSWISGARTWPICAAAPANCWCATTRERSRSAGDAHRPRRGLAGRRTLRPRERGDRGTGPVERETRSPGRHGATDRDYGQVRSTVRAGTNSIDRCATQCPYEGSPNRSRLTERPQNSGLPTPSELDYGSASYIPLPWYWVDENKLDSPASWFVGFRKTARAGDERTVMVSVVCPFGNPA